MATHIFLRICESLCSARWSRFQGKSKNFDLLHQAMLWHWVHFSGISMDSWDLGRLPMPQRCSYVRPTQTECEAASRSFGFDATATEFTSAVLCCWKCTQVFEHGVLRAAICCSLGPVTTLEASTTHRFVVALFPKNLFYSCPSGALIVLEAIMTTCCCLPRSDVMVTTTISHQSPTGLRRPMKTSEF